MLDERSAHTAILAIVKIAMLSLNSRGAIKMQAGTMLPTLNQPAQQGSPNYRRSQYWQTTFTRRDNIEARSGNDVRQMEGWLQCGGTILVPRTDSDLEHRLQPSLKYTVTCHQVRRQKASLGSNMLVCFRHGS